MNNTCQKKKICDCKEEDKWLEGKPDHVTMYRYVAIAYDGTRKVIFETECFAEAKKLHDELEITHRDSFPQVTFSPEKTEIPKQFNYGADV